MTDVSAAALGAMIRDARKQRQMTQAQLATELGTSQSAIHRIEAGNQNLSLEMINRIAGALDSPLLAASAAPTNMRIHGARPLHGAIATRTSKNAAVALLCASLLNHGRTVLKDLARIEEVNRILEVLGSIGVRATWSADGRELALVRPERLNLDKIDVVAARRTRSALMFLPPLLAEFDSFELPYAGGCHLGQRTIEPHLQALRKYGLSVVAHDGFYQCTVDRDVQGDVAFTMIERGDTATENAILAAAMYPGRTTIRNASPNYMVQDLCFFLLRLGVEIEGIGSTTLRIKGKTDIDVEVEYSPSEDPIEAMSLITAGVVTHSSLTIQRAPMEFLEIELAILEQMGLELSVGEEYQAANGKTRLADIEVRPSHLRAPLDKIHPMPFPGLNIDNLPLFAVIAASADGETLIHDWVFEERAIHMLELNKLGARVKLLDPHRIVVDGPTRWRGADVVSPPALRPAVCLLWAALAAKGETTLRDVYVINRGYEDLPGRLTAIGADIEVFR